jgi:hypothetical protein
MHCHILSAQHLWVASGDCMGEDCVQDSWKVIFRESEEGLTMSPPCWRNQGK